MNAGRTGWTGKRLAGIPDLPRRELYELELSSRTPPIMRVTEKPRASDTEVSYMDEEKKQSPSDELMEAWQKEQEDDDNDGSTPDPSGGF